MDKYLNEFKELGSERLGQVGVNKEGDQMVIVEYNDYKDVTVVFPKTNCKVHTQYVNFLKGYVKNYNKVRFGNHGYLGQGKYKSEGRDSNGNRQHIQAYESWRKMHLRAENFDGEHPSYADVTICEEWWNYQNFAAWFEENYYDIEDDFMCVDKDIINPISKIYSPETCCIVPNKINDIFKKPKSDTKELPTGVHLRKDMKAVRYRSRTKVYDEYGNLKTVSKTTKTPEEAFEFYKENKEKYIKQVAYMYKPEIPERVYIAMMNYKVVPYLD